MTARKSHISTTVDALRSSMRRKPGPKAPYQGPGWPEVWMKRCPTCRREKTCSRVASLSRFGWRSDRDCPQSNCRECDRLRINAYRQTDAGVARAREYMSRPEVVAARREYDASPTRKRARVANNASWRATPMGRLKSARNNDRSKLKRASTPEQARIIQRRVDLAEAEIERLSLSLDDRRQPRRLAKPQT